MRKLTLEERQSGGVLLWMRTTKRSAIEVPLEILDDEQRQRLDEYLFQDDQIFDNSNKARLIWEYIFFPRHTLLVGPAGASQQNVTV